MPKNFLDNLQKKPEKERRRILWISVISLGLIIFLTWFFVFPHESTVPPEKSREAREKIENSKQEIRKITDKVNISNISSDLKEATEELIKENKEEERVVEIPRLPMEK